MNNLIKTRGMILFIIIPLISLPSFSQSVTDLYQQRKFKDLIEYESKSKKLTADELYYVGYAFFQLANDDMAIKMYDKAIAKGLDEDYVYLYKGLSLRYQKQFKKAIQNFSVAIEKNPESQKNITELGNAYYLQSKYDSAVIYFKKARDLDFELGDPYFKLPNSYHLQEKYDLALTEYYKSASLIDKEDKEYLEILRSIGQLEYSFTKDYSKAITAYTKAIDLVPNDYSLYPKLIKSYIANKEFIKGDSLVQIMRTAYFKNELPEDLMKYKSVIIDQFHWNGQRINAQEYFEEPKEFPDMAFKFFLIDQAGKSVERTIHTEKTEIEVDGVKHLICEYDKKTGAHRTYPFGFQTDKIHYETLKKYVLIILEEDIDPQASSKKIKSEKK